MYARLREAFVKVGPGEARTGLATLIDTSASMDWPNEPAGGRASRRPTKLRHAQELAAMLAAVALLAADSARIASLADGAAVVGAELGGAALLAEALAALEAQTVGRHTQLAAAVRAHRLAAPPADVVVLLTDALVPDGDLDDALDELRRAGRATTLVHVTDPDERRPPAEGPVELVDRETGERRVVNRTADAVAAHVARFDARTEALRERCRARDIAYVGAPTDVPALDIVFERAREAGVVGA